MTTNPKNSSLDKLTAEMDAAFTTKSTKETVESNTPPQITYIQGQPWSPELVITLTISIFSLAALILIMATFTMINRKLSGAYALKLYTIVIIISFSSFLCITGYDSNQLSSVFGLFGAIAGYLLGKEDNKLANTGSAQPYNEQEKQQDEKTQI